MRAIITALFLILLSQSAGAELMEFQLTDKLDEPRGYCIDIRGHKESAKFNRGLQAHTCYSYQGQIGVDQAFDKTSVKLGKFYIPYFNVCMEAKELIKGATLVLKECTNGIKQNFTHTLNKTIKHMGKNNLCVTVAKGKSKKGRGGTPPHLMRHLIIDDCQEVENQYNTWQMIN